jgi:hypothetical protein
MSFGGPLCAGLGLGQIESRDNIVPGGLVGTVPLADSQLPPMPRPPALSWVTLVFQTRGRVED